MNLLTKILAECESRAKMIPSKRSDPRGPLKIREHDASYAFDERLPVREINIAESQDFANLAAQGQVAKTTCKMLTLQSGWPGKLSSENSRRIRSNIGGETKIFASCGKRWLRTKVVFSMDSEARTYRVHVTRHCTVKDQNSAHAAQNTNASRQPAFHLLRPTARMLRGVRGRRKEKTSRTTGGETVANSTTMVRQTQRK